MGGTSCSWVCLFLVCQQGKIGTLAGGIKLSVFRSDTRPSPMSTSLASLTMYVDNSHPTVSCELSRLTCQSIPFAEHFSPIQLMALGFVLIREGAVCTALFIVVNGES